MGQAHQVADDQHTIDERDTMLALAMLGFLRRAGCLRLRSQQIKDSTVPCHWRNLPKWRVTALERESAEAAGTRLRKRHRKVREQLLMFVSDWEAQTQQSGRQGASRVRGEAARLPEGAVGELRQVLRCGP